MKLTYFPYKPIEMTVDQPTILQTNNVAVMTDWVSGLRDLNDKIKLSDDSYNSVDISKGIHWIGDPFLQVDLNKVFEAPLQKRLVEVLDDDARSKLFELDKALKSAVFDASFSLNLPLAVGNDFDPLKMIKYSGIAFAEEIKSDPYDIIESVIKVAFQLKITKIITLVNVHNYLSVNQFHELVSVIKALDLTTLFIDFSESNHSELFDECRYSFVDEDFIDWRN
ncbi:putative CRISPR-associated protein [Secundilactobacillus oryzae JCM 18671]|uniref:Putative CRISPR-associated protein n=1 Tax=Secundilactobacillus oryzae JCM 18671 TaxID=1291743 RepID=A0A081BKV7_9LACO|nr:type II-A CRISPR-associated protein Csn2 [Secundilactobacillus oryzae]GAK48675.1 putative CRISPR-associated protein [Secundilactobacillus oryzae JCM 18671]